MRKFNQEEKDEICNIIGVWYTKWKGKIANYKERTHKLGYAKEELKEMICDNTTELQPKTTVNISLQEWEIMTILDWYKAAHHFVGYSNCPRQIKYCHAVKKKLYEARERVINASGRSTSRW